MYVKQCMSPNVSLILLAKGTLEMERWTLHFHQDGNGRSSDFLGGTLR